MAVVHDIFLIRLQLDLVNGPEAVQHERSFSTDLEDEETLSPQQSAAQALHFAFDDDPVGAGQETVFLDHVLIHTVEFQDNDFAWHRRGQ